MHDAVTTAPARIFQQGEEGVALLELVGALTILSVGFLALAASMGLGFRQVSLARQRQSASEIASGRIEHVRNVPYDNVALSSQPSRSTDAGNPDYFISTDGTQFDFSGHGTYEPLIVGSDGQVQHVENPVTVGNTSLAIYQYVTWVDDPAISGAQDYRRMTVVVVYNKPSVQGISTMLRTSSFFTTGHVTVGGSTGGAQPGTSSSPTASPTGTPSPPPGSCTGDTSPPSGNFTIQSGTGSETGYTNSLTATLSFPGLTDACEPIVLSFSNNNTTFGVDVTYNPANPAISWALIAGDGTKSVWARIRDGANNATSAGPRNIVVDTIAPTVPGTLTRTVSCEGGDRTVNLSWGSSTDTNFRGYRVYKSVNNNSVWTPIATVSGTLKSDTDSKGYDSLRYRVVGYDKAGNESNATNIVVLSKNQCS